MGSFITKEQLFTKEWFRAYGFILFGTFVMAVGYVYFITPHKIVPGGIYGIAIVLHHTYGLPIGMVSLAFNIPLTIIGTKILGPRFGVKSVFAFVISAIFIDFLSWYSEGVALVPDEPLLSSVFGGALIGIGVGFMFKARATAGGTDVVAMILEKFTKLPLGQIMVAVDSVIVLIALAAFGDWKIPLFSWVVIFVFGKTVDIVLQGMSVQRALFIVFYKYDEIAKSITGDLNRGGTMFDGTGIFNKTEKKVIFTVVSRREVEILKIKIYTIDPGAFITVMEAKEIIGKGFKPLVVED